MHALDRRGPDDGRVDLATPLALPDSEPDSAAQAAPIESGRHEVHAMNAALTERNFIAR
jgi:hypothetical protein